MNREPISQALFTILAGAYPWKSCSRQAKIFPNADVQPVMYLIAPDEVDNQPDMALTDYELHYVCLIYFIGDPSPDGSAHPFPDTVINGIIQAIEAKLGTPTGERVQNMQVVGQQPSIAAGGTAQPTLVTNVINCYIKGTIYKDSAILSQQGSIEIPITVLAGI